MSSSDSESEGDPIEILIIQLRNDREFQDIFDAVVRGNQLFMRLNGAHNDALHIGEREIAQSLFNNGWYDPNSPSQNVLMLNEVEYVLALLNAEYNRRIFTAQLFDNNNGLNHADLAETQALINILTNWLNNQDINSSINSNSDQEGYSDDFNDSPDSGFNYSGASAAAGGNSYRKTKKRGKSHRFKKGAKLSKSKKGGKAKKYRRTRKSLPKN